MWICSNPSIKKHQKCFFINFLFYCQVNTRSKKINQMNEDITTLRHELDVYRMLSHQESAAIKTRTEDLRDSVRREMDRNNILQSKHKRMTESQEELRAALQ